MVSVIITAGGVGKRMKTNIPKQFLLLNKHPVLMYTIQKFHAFDASMQLILTLPKEWQEYWQELQEKHNFSIAHKIVDGGKERFHSIQNALQVCEGEIIAVHDGVRPLLSHKTIEDCLQLAKEKGAAVPVLKMKESIRKIEKNGNSIAVKRSDFVSVQTPQCFQKAIILESYRQAFRSNFTDDASVVEAAGYPVFLSEGNEENIKITSPEDLKVAELFI